MASTPSSTTTGETGGGSSSGGSETPPMQQNGNTVVHVRHDSEKSFNELFSVVKSGAGNQRPLQVPWSMRKLPDSFFRPPSTGSKSSPCHSREPSTDNTLDPMSPGMQSVGSPQPQPQQQQQQQQQPLHSRAHSSPASLQQTLSLAQQQSQQHQQMHLRQPSYDVSSPLDNQMPLPPGWEMAKTPQGQIYFMNHITKTTQWEDPRKQIALQQMPHLNRGQQQQPPPPQPPQQQPPPPQHQRSNSSGSFDSVGALPQGWDQSVTEEGEIYFINHTTRETTWFDPRIPIQKQSVPIRHPQPQMQQQQQQQQPPPQPPQPGMASGSPLSVEQKRMQDLRLQRLENERRALQQRQAELKRLEMERRAQSQGDMQAAMNQTQEMLMRQSLQENNSAGGGDPFLGANAQQQQQQQQSDLHNRQESADSGVGMGSNFNLGSIPEVDMDNAMDVSTDLDTTLTEATVNTPTAAAAAAANAAAGGPGAAAGETNTAPSADLMATLPDEIVGEVLSRDSLTWL